MFRDKPNKVGSARVTSYWVAFLQLLFQWKNDKYCTFWKSVCSLTYPACTRNVHAPYFHLVPKFAGSNPAEAVGFFGRKNSQHAFVRRVSKAVCPVSQLCGMLKNLSISWKSDCLAKLTGHFSPILPPFANTGLSRCLACSAWGDERGN
jgi:hypothetical protein